MKTDRASLSEFYLSQIQPVERRYDFELSTILGIIKHYYAFMDNKGSSFYFPNDTKESMQERFDIMHKFLLTISKSDMDIIKDYIQGKFLYEIDFIQRNNLDKNIYLFKAFDFILALDNNILD